MYADKADGMWIITCLITRWLLVRRNIAKEAAQAGQTVKNENAFDDLTDIQNPDFRYSL